MRDKKTLLNKLFLLIAALGTIFVLLEMVLQSMGSSICATAGCKIVSNAARFGDISILLIGLALFAVLLALALQVVRFNKPGADRLIDQVLIVSLAAEGFFTGYQAFRIQTPCIFCLAVFGFLIVLSLLRIFAGRKEIFAGFAALAAVFSLFYLILPAESHTRIPEGRQMVLFYSKDCQYCAQIMKEFEENKLPVEHVQVTGYSGLLKSMGIEHVPTLFVDKGEEKFFLTGKEAISRYLASRDGAPGKKTDRMSRPGETKNPSSADKRRSNNNDLFTRGDKLFEPVLPSAEDGMCKQDEECK